MNRGKVLYFWVNRGKVLDNKYNNPILIKKKKYNNPMNHARFGNVLEKLAFADKPGVHKSKTDIKS